MGDGHKPHIFVNADLGCLVADTRHRDTCVRARGCGVGSCALLCAIFDADFSI